MKAAEIHNEQTLKSWLRVNAGASQRSGLYWITFRAAARVFPLFAVSTDSSSVEPRGGADLTSLPVLRCLLSAHSFCRQPTATLRLAADTAMDAAARSASRTTAAGGAARMAARTAHLLSGKMRSISAALNATLEVEGPRWQAANYSFSQAVLDAISIEAGESREYSPLWDEVPIWFAQCDLHLTESWRQDQSGKWDFWLRWWIGLVGGHALPWSLQERVALIPDAIWQQGPMAVAEEIRRIELGEYLVPPSVKAAAEKLMRAAIGQFTFDQMRDIISLEGFADDLKRVRDPEVIEAFLLDAEELREQIETLELAFRNEGRAMQGAGGLRTYLGKINEEFAKARQVNLLRVGLVLDWAGVLQHACMTGEVSREIAPLDKPLSQIVGRLDSLIRNYFAAALVRVAPLKDIRSSDDLSLGELLQDIRRGLDVIRKAKANGLTPLDAEALAVLNSMIEQTDQLVRRELSLPVGVQKAGLRREIDFRIAQATVSLLLYREAMPKYTGTALNLLTVSGGYANNFNDLKSFVEMVMGLFGRK